MTSWTRRSLTITAVLALGCSPLWAKPKKAPPKKEDSLKQAELAWQHRDQPYQTESAIVLWERAIQEQPTRTDLYITLTKAAGRAYRHAKTDKERDYWSTEGRAYGAQAVEKNPQNPVAYAEYGAALGQWAQAHKGIGSLKVVKLAVQNLEKAISMDPHYAYAHMLLGQFYEHAPGLFSIGDKKKALEHAKLAVEYGPNATINHKTLAKIYLARGMKTEAKAELEKTLSLKAPADAIPETLADQEDARELLKQLDQNAKSN